MMNWLTKLPERVVPVIFPTRPAPEEELIPRENVRMRAVTGRQTRPRNGGYLVQTIDQMIDEFAAKAVEYERNLDQATVQIDDPPLRELSRINSRLDGGSFEESLIEFKPIHEELKALERELQAVFVEIAPHLHYHGQLDVESEETVEAHMLLGPMLTMNFDTNMAHTDTSQRLYELHDRILDIEAGKDPIRDSARQASDGMSATLNRLGNRKAALIEAELTELRRLRDT